MMPPIGDLRRYLGLGWRLGSFLRERITLADAQADVRRRIAGRESHFLWILRECIFRQPKSPYRHLCSWAGIDEEDVVRMVRADGLEATLRCLHRAGVYVTFEEFKGRTPIVRGGKTLAVDYRDFDNPHLAYYYIARSGGTTGPGMPLAMDLDYIAAQAPLLMLAYHSHGLLDAPTAIWCGLLPDISGIANVLRGARFGHRVHKWFIPVTAEELHEPLKYRAVTYYILGLTRLYGLPAPWPEPLRLDEALVLARWAAETRDRIGRCLVRATVSKALRIALAAEQAGLRLDGVAFLGGGEPPTPAKVAGITRSGARWVPIYVLTETGLVGIGCCDPRDGNDLHLVNDGLALIQHSREVPLAGSVVDAFYFTTLLPTAPKILLNVESDDYGEIDHRRCGCPLEHYGFTEHLRHIRSFKKLTAEAVTLVGSDVVRILEEVLPARFGGTALDYQLLEEEDPAGFTRLSLVISPRVPLTDERAVADTLLAHVGRGTGAILRQAQTLRVRRMEPVWTARGKLMPLHLARATRAEPVRR